MSSRVIVREEHDVNVFVKALFRRAQTYYKWDRYQCAKDDIEEALKYSDDKSIYKL